MEFSSVTFKDKVLEHDGFIILKISLFAEDAKQSDNFLGTVWLEVVSAIMLEGHIPKITFSVI